MVAQVILPLHTHPERLCLPIALQERRLNQTVHVCKADLRLTQHQHFRVHMTALAPHLIALRAPLRQTAPLEQQLSQMEHVWKADLLALIQEVQ